MNPPTSPRWQTVVVAAENPCGLDSPVGSCFDTCQYLLVATLLRGSLVGYAVVGNPSVAGGATHTACALVRRFGGQVVVAGSIDPNARRALESLNIRVVTGASGSVRSVVDSALTGMLAEPDNDLKLPIPRNLLAHA